MLNAAFELQRNFRQGKIGFHGTLKPWFIPKPSPPGCENYTDTTGTSTPNPLRRCRPCGALFRPLHPSRSRLQPSTRLLGRRPQVTFRSAPRHFPAAVLSTTRSRTAIADRSKNLPHRGTEPTLALSQMWRPHGSEEAKVANADEALGKQMAIFRQLPSLDVGTIAHAASGPWYTGVPRRVFYVFNFLKLRFAFRCRARKEIRLHKHDRAGSRRQTRLSLKVGFLNSLRGV